MPPRLLSDAFSRRVTVFFLAVVEIRFGCFLARALFFLFEAGVRARDEEVLVGRGADATNSGRRCSVVRRSVRFLTDSETAIDFVPPRKAGPG